VIGQGVETKEQLAFLATQGCDEIQGFYFCRPLSAEECAEFMRRYGAGAGNLPQASAAGPKRD